MSSVCHLQHCNAMQLWSGKWRWSHILWAVVKTGWGRRRLLQCIDHRCLVTGHTQLLTTIRCSQQQWWGILVKITCACYTSKLYQSFFLFENTDLSLSKFPSNLLTMTPQKASVTNLKLNLQFLEFWGDFRYPKMNVHDVQMSAFFSSTRVNLSRWMWPILSAV